MNIKVFFLSILIAVSSICFGQAKDTTNDCDEDLIYKLVNLQIKVLGKEFHRADYFLEIETKESYYIKNDSVYYITCNNIINWNKNKIKSKRIVSTILKDSIKMLDYSCFISLPVFNKDKTECKIYASTHQSEWCGYGAVFYYKKISGKWKMINRDVFWVT